MKNTLIVFAKKPQAGEVKTRLVPPLTSNEAKELYSCFLKDALIQYTRLAAELNIKIFLFVTPDNSMGYFGDFLKDIPEINASKLRMTIMAQSGYDLGEKIFNAFTYAFSENYAQAVIIGTDHPTLPDDYIVQAFAELGKGTTDCVIGPVEDGGFYLLGLKEVKNEYFKNVPWSSSKVFDLTVDNLNRAKKTVHTLPGWYDVDDKESLSKIIGTTSQNDFNNVPAYSKRFLSQIKSVEV